MYLVKLTWHNPERVLICTDAKGQEFLDNAEAQLYCDALLASKSCHEAEPVEKCFAPILPVAGKQGNG